MRAVLVSIFAAALLAGHSLAMAAEPRTDEEKALYALGLAISQSIGSFGLSAAELDIVKAGLTDGALGKPTKVDLEAYYPRLLELQNARIAAAGKAVLDKAAAEKGAQRTASGLVITTLREGSGPAPKASDTVKVHYQGTLPDGKVFDSSIERNEPATFALDGVIACWTEGLQLMKVGGKSRLVCPAALAYGDRGAPPDIYPGATLIFDVELLGIETPVGP